MIIDDNMFIYDTRSTKFVNLDFDIKGYVGQSDWPGAVESYDCIFRLALSVKAESKVITRTRRKFWDDVSLRGGQYSALMILLTATYMLFQGPFQDMKYGLKFAQMRAMDGLSTQSE